MKVVHISIVGNWGLGDLFNLDPVLSTLQRQHQGELIFKINGPCGILKYRSDFGGSFDCARVAPDFTILGYKEMGAEKFGELERLPSLRNHMGFYFGLSEVVIEPSLHLSRRDHDAIEKLRIKHDLDRDQPHLFISTDGIDPRRHPRKDWWLRVISSLRDSVGKTCKFIKIGHQEQLTLMDRYYLRRINSYVDHDLSGLDIRLTAGLVRPDDIYIGPSSGLFQYLQSQNCFHIALFSLNDPKRYIFQRNPEKIIPIIRNELPCIRCMEKSFEFMSRAHCIANDRACCISGIKEEQIISALKSLLTRISRAKT